jgi:hypothetical protein
MSGVYAAAVLDGPLGPPAAGCVRLLSSTLTREASAVFGELAARWRADAARARQAAPAPAAKGKRGVAAATAAEHPWAELLSPLDLLGCLAGADDISRSLCALIGVQTVRDMRLCCAAHADADNPGLRCSQATQPLPADPPTHPGIESFLIGRDDERTELRGQARAPQSDLHDALSQGLTTDAHRSVVCVPRSRSPLAQTRTRCDMATRLRFAD